jgi:hypothetical protein
MISSGHERQSIGQPAACSLMFFTSAAIVAVILEIAWRDWTLFALGWAGIYFLGGVRWFPWGTPIRKAFSIGVFVGTSLPTIVWIYKLNH